SAGGPFDVFAWKLAANGDTIWARSFGGTGNDKGSAVAVDSAGGVYLTGQGIVNLSGGDGKAFVAKLDANGTLAWATGLAGPLGNGVAVAPDGKVHVAGQGFFVTTLDAIGLVLAARGPSGPLPNGIAVDGGGNVLTT